jgi:hypothetical protein
VRYTATPQIEPEIIEEINTVVVIPSLHVVLELSGGQILYPPFGRYQVRV